MAMVPADFYVRRESFTPISAQRLHDLFALGQITEIFLDNYSGGGEIVKAYGREGRIYRVFPDELLHAWE